MYDHRNKEAVGGAGAMGEIRAKGVAEGTREMGERARRWQGRQSSEGLYFKIHPRLSRPRPRPIGKGMDFSTIRSPRERKRDDGSTMPKQKSFIRRTRRPRTDYGLHGKKMVVSTKKIIKHGIASLPGFKN